MDFVDLLAVSDKNKHKTAREVELSTGHKVVVKDYIPIATIRAIATVTASASLTMREGDVVPKIDYALLDVARVFGIVQHLTDIDISNTNMNTLYDTLMESGLWKELEEEFNEDLIRTIDDYIQKYIEEEIRNQEVSGKLGYQLVKLVEDIVEDRDNSVKKFLELAEKEGLNLLGENPKTKK